MAKATILLLDQSHSQIEIFQKVLVDYHIIMHTDGNNLGTFLLTHQVDLIFVNESFISLINFKDINIPKIFILSSYTPKNIENVYSNGGIDYIFSPVNTKELYHKVSLHLSHKSKDKINTETILSNLLFPVFITSQKRRVIIYANKFALELYEFTQEDIMNKAIDEVYTLKDGPDEIIHKLKTYGKVNNYEAQITTHTGKEFTGLLAVVPITYNGEDCYIGMTVDITNQKRIEEKIRSLHRHTQESIEYASLIQGALLSDSDNLNKYFEDSFILWEPKDIIGGDIYLFEPLNDNECLLYVIDCTGHGVPGAFVTMLVKAVQNQVTAFLEQNSFIEPSPAWIMGYFNKTFKRLLKQEETTSKSNAGWDGGIIYYNRQDKIIKFAGALTPLFYIDEQKELQTLTSNRYSVGYKKCDMNYEYNETVIQVEKGMKFYCTTDGYLDQNGGKKDFPFGKKRFQNILKTNHKKSMAQQKRILKNTLGSYQNFVAENDRNDDITVIGFTI